MSPAPFDSAGPVFSINFIRHRTLPHAIRRTLTYAALGYLTIHLILMLALLGSAWSAYAQRRQVQAAAGVAARASDPEMVSLQQRALKHLATLQNTIALQQQGFPVAAKWAALTKTLPPRTWITEVSGLRDHRTMTIHAAYLIDSQVPYEVPIKAWVETLKADPAFGPGLKRLEMTNSARKSQGRATLDEFELVAEWHPASH